MLASEFSFELPDELIAKVPASPRDSSRLLVVDRKTGRISHSRFLDLAEYLKPKDLIILNDTKVLPARLIGYLPTGGRIELLLLQSIAESEHVWSCLVKPGRRVRGGLTVEFAEGVKARVESPEGTGFVAHFPSDLNFYDWLDRAGVTPLPPYIKRESTDQDRNDYQTIFAKTLGSVAAPTAGLHFTERVFESLKKKGVERASVTLHVGYGTFAPMDWTHPDSHKMHSERYEVPPETLQAMELARSEESQIVAVGTTALRTLESIPLHGLKGETDIFIKPGYPFKNTDALVTNFHVPESSLFVLVSAFMGRELAQEAYAAAIKERYRFYSFGDAMLIL